MATTTDNDMDTMLADIAAIRNLDIDGLRARIDTIAKNENAEPEIVARRILDDLHAHQETAIAPVETGQENKRSRSLIIVSKEQAVLLKAAGRMPNDATPVEMDYAFAVANRLGLDPMRKQIQFIRFEKGSPIEPYISIGGLEAIAARSGDWAGVDMPVIETDDSGQLVAVSITVYRIVHGIRCPFSTRVLFNEFAKKRNDGQLRNTWATMGTHMLEKVALANAIRMAFPEEVSELYVEEEVDK
jgi:phage recombination protein Bet